MIAVNLQRESPKRLRDHMFAAKARKWRRENPRDHSARQRRWRDSHPENAMLIGVRQRAKITGLPFNLELSDIALPSVCPVLGIPLRRGNTGKAAPTDNSPSLDRLNPALGYVKGNVRVISNRANMIRNNATVAELRAVLRYAESPEVL